MGMFPQFGEPIFADYFTGLGADVTINGRTPDVPYLGATWSQGTSTSSFEGTGTGAVRHVNSDSGQRYSVDIDGCIAVFRYTRESSQAANVHRLMVCQDNDMYNGECVEITSYDNSDIYVTAGTINFGSYTTAITIGNVALALGASMDFAVIAGTGGFAHPIQVWYKASGSSTWLDGGAYTSSSFPVNPYVGIYCAYEENGAEPSFDFVEVYPLVAPTATPQLFISEQCSGSAVDFEGRTPDTLANGYQWDAVASGKVLTDGSGKGYFQVATPGVGIDLSPSLTPDVLGIAVSLTWVANYNDGFDNNSIRILIGGNALFSSTSYVFADIMSHFEFGYGGVLLDDQYNPSGQLGNFDTAIGAEQESHFLISVYFNGYVEVYDLLTDTVVGRSFTMSGPDLGGVVQLGTGANFRDLIGIFDNVQIYLLMGESASSSEPIGSSSESSSSASASESSSSSSSSSSAQVAESSSSASATESSSSASESSSESLASCSAIVYDPHGRQGIAVAQPQSGTDFPLVHPSADIRYLLADFYLAYDDPSDYPPASDAFVLPFRIKWIYGLGCMGAEQPIGMPTPTPTHDADIVVVDANDEVVFDSTVADDFLSKTWSDRLHIYAWETTDPAKQPRVCRLVTHTAWTGDTPTARNYPEYLTPVAAVLDERTTYRMPRRVKSLTAVLDTLRQTRVEFIAGYNMELLRTGTNTGGRFAEEITINATPGAGLGIFPGCEPTPLVIRTINNVAPTDPGDFFLAVYDCYWLRQPTELVSSSPRLTSPYVPVYPPDIDIEDIPAELLEPMWPADATTAHLQLGNDCEPCCRCEDYVATAQYLNSERNKFRALGQQLEATRDLYHTNLDRWGSAINCFHRRPVRLVMRAQRCPFLDVALQFCNQRDECVTDVDLSVTFSAPGIPGTVLQAFTLISGVRPKPGRVSGTIERYEMSGSWPTFTAHWDAVQPFQSVDVRFRLDFGTCNTPALVDATLTGTIDGVAMQVPQQLPLTGTEAASDRQSVSLDCPPKDDGVGPGTYCPGP